jgi:BlaI family transcriptional regulator, penicillinase repressor
MPRERQDITEAELGVMQVLWDRGPSAIRQITDVIYRRGEADAARYATVQKQLERLEAKGFVRRDRSLFVHVFSAAVQREELIGRRLREMADKLCGGSLAPILSHLARTELLTRAERRALRELIEAPDEEDGGGHSAGPERKGKRKTKG